MNREILYQNTSDTSRVVTYAESYADSVHPAGRSTAKRAYLDGYLQAMEHEGLYADDCQKRLSQAYSSLKDTHYCMKEQLREQIKTGPVCKEKRRELYLLLKKEFDGE